jgi:ribosome-associated protein YbcJ (S4-like RNA binding protein)
LVFEEEVPVSANAIHRRTERIRGQQSIEIYQEWIAAHAGPADVQREDE